MRRVRTAAPRRADASARDYAVRTDRRPATASAIAATSTALAVAVKEAPNRKIMAAAKKSRGDARP